MRTRHRRKREEKRGLPKETKKSEKGGVFWEFRPRNSSKKAPRALNCVGGHEKDICCATVLLLIPGKMGRQAQSRQIEAAMDHAWATTADGCWRSGRMGFSPCGQGLAESEDKRGEPKGTKEGEKGSVPDTPCASSPRYSNTEPLLATPEEEEPKEPFGFRRARKN
jgi:hypothetical protein